MSYVNTYFMGPIVFRLQRTHSSEVGVKVISYACPAYKLPPPTTRTGNLNMAALLNTVAEDPVRTRRIVDTVVDLAAQGRQLLVLSDRRQHCHDLHDACRQHALDCGLYLGSMKLDDLRASEACQVIVSTYAMVSEGWDKTSLDCLVLATPRTDVNQSCGRILREAPGKMHTPLIIDVKDVQGVFIAQYRKRMTFYKSQGFSVHREDDDVQSPTAPRRQLSICSFLDDS